METSDQEALKLNMAEQRKQYNQKKREKEEAILQKAIDLLNQNKEIMSLEENDIVRKADEIKAKRLKISESLKKYRQKRKSAATPEEIQAMRLKKLEQTRSSRQKRKAVATPEEKEAMKLKHSEQTRKYKKKKRDKENSILKNAIELLNQSRELSLEENDILRKAEVIKAQRLKRSEDSKQYFHNRKATATSEEVEAMKFKHLEKVRQYRQEKREQLRQLRQEKREKEESILKKAMELPIQNEEISLEEKLILKKAKEIEEMRLIRVERVRRSRQKKREKEEPLLKKAMELLSKNQQLSFEENEIVSKAEEIKANRSKIKQYSKQYFLNRKAASTPEEEAAMRLKNSEQTRRFRQNRKAAATPKEESMRFKHSEQNRKYRQNKREKEESILRHASELLIQDQEMSSKKKEVLRLSRLADKIKADRWNESQLKMKIALGRRRTNQVFDEIKIEKEVLQETTIKAISARQNANSALDMQQGYNDTSCSWLEFSEKSFMTGETSKNHSYFQSFHGGSSSVQFDRRKLGLEKSFRGMRVLIDATAKRDGHAIFGNQIAQKLRSSMKNVAEVNIAKQLIDDILQNLAIGVYSFKTKIV